MINTTLIYNNLPLLLHGLKNSLLIALFSLVIGVSGGTLISLCLLSKQKIIKNLARLYIAIFRGTPMLIQILTFFCLFSLYHIISSPLIIAIIVIGCNSAAYLSKVIEHAILLTPQGEQEGAHALGFSSFEVYRYIIFPHSIRSLLPNLLNEAITLIKDSSLAHVIGASELTFQGNIIIGQTYEAVTVYFFLGCTYFCIIHLFSFLFYLCKKKIYANKNF
jgi:His/Glu/Gln/Arg/opine family amino acid ABC transporter permease subunit